MNTIFSYKEGWMAPGLGGQDLKPAPFVPKWHYFRDNQSLCKRHSINAWGGLEPEHDINHPNNCKVCAKKLMKRLGLCPEVKGNHENRNTDEKS